MGYVMKLAIAGILSVLTLNGLAEGQRLELANCYLFVHAEPLLALDKVELITTNAISAKLTSPLRVKGYKSGEQCFDRVFGVDMSQMDEVKAAFDLLTPSSTLETSFPMACHNEHVGVEIVHRRDKYEIRIFDFQKFRRTPDMVDCRFRWALCDAHGRPRVGFYLVGSELSVDAEGGRLLLDGASYCDGNGQFSIGLRVRNAKTKDVLLEGVIEGALSKEGKLSYIDQYQTRADGVGVDISKEISAGEAGEGCARISITYRKVSLAVDVVVDSRRSRETIN